MSSPVQRLQTAYWALLVSKWSVYRVLAMKVYIHALEIAITCNSIFPYVCALVSCICSPVVTALEA